MTRRLYYLVAKAVFFACVISLLVITQDSCRKSNSVKIGILYTEPHPVLTTIIEAFKARVKESIPDAVFVEQHGSGSKAQYPATVRAVIDQGVDLLAPVTTPMSIETLSQASGRVPVVFLGVTDPVGAELLNSLDNPEKCSGVSDNPPMDGVIELVRLYLPQAKSIGIPYDPTDQPGVITAKQTAAIGEAGGLKVELRPVTSESELRAAVRGLSAQVDALVIGMDNLMMKNAGIISRTAMEQGKPLFAADNKSVEMGAVAGVGVDYADVGRLGGDIAVKVLKDHQPVGKIPVEMLKTGQVFFNEQVANSLKLLVPNEIRDRGKRANP
jgi:putative tryptophan/tyrosine transport system substrate-binding protein